LTHGVEIFLGHNDVVHSWHERSI